MEILWHRHFFICSSIKKIQSEFEHNRFSTCFLSFVVLPFRIVHLSLRFCEMNDSGAEKLALALGNLKKQNWKLLNLILTGNQIGNRGAKALATV